MIYRFAQLEDLDQLVELRVLMQLEVNEVSTDAVSEEYLAKVRSFFQDNIPTQKYFAAVALDGQHIIGTAGVCLYKKPPSISGGSGLVGYVTNVFTARSHRKQGIATQLMKKLIELGAEIRADKLHLGATADGAGIYKKVGFEEPRFLSLEMKSLDLFMERKE
jgi:GNAT superfamily N-acetyltransferase